MKLVFEVGDCYVGYRYVSVFALCLGFVIVLWLFDIWVVEVVDCDCSAD